MINIKLLQRFGKECSGGTMIGYGLITALIAVSALGATQLVGERLDSVYGDIGTTINGGSPNPPAPPTLPKISVSNASGGENGTITFMVSLSEAASDTVSVSYATANGTAEASSDYTPASGTITFAPGQTSASIDVTTLDDGDAEDDETFTLNLTSPTNGTIAGGTATGTIIDDDVIPSLSIADASGTEGSSITFTVSLSAPAGQDVSFDYATSNATATSPSDYYTDSGTLTITAGQTSTTFNVFGAGDSQYEGNETFTVTLSNVTNATLADGSAIGTVIEDDPAPTVTLATNFISVAIEGTTLQFDVNLSYAVPTEEITVTLAYIDGTATAGSDYAATETSVVIPAGQIGATVTVPHTQDSIFEGDETFDVVITAVSGGNAVIGEADQVTVTIENDDPVPFLTAESPVLGFEGGNAPVRMELDRASAFDITVTVFTAGGGESPEATPEEDYVPLDYVTYTIPAGSTELIVDISIIDDAVSGENNESFYLYVDSADGADKDFILRSLAYISDND